MPIVKITHMTVFHDGNRVGYGERTDDDTWHAVGVNDEGGVTELGFHPTWNAASKAITDHHGLPEANDDDEQEGNDE